jgi:septum formation protein
LQSAGVDPEVIVSGVDEDGVTGTPGEVALLLAQHKVAAVVERLTSAGTGAGAGGNATPTTLVLACDSVLELDGIAHGKPADAATAVERWKSMRGRRGVLHTGHSLVRMDDAQQQSRHALASAEVRFGSPTDAEIVAYVATGEPLLVAGGFTLDRLGGWFVESIDGDPGTVLGLSLPLLRTMLADIGVGVPTLWGRK